MANVVESVQDLVFGTWLCKAFQSGCMQGLGFGSWTCVSSQTVWQCYTLRYVLGLGFGLWPCKAFQSTVYWAVLYDVFSRLQSSS